jgi:predicted nucleic acid-binding protein
MRYWDSSAIVPLLVLEAQTTWALDLLRSDSVGITWELSRVEVHSALARSHRAGRLGTADLSAARNRASLLFSSMSQVITLDLVADRALRVLGLHALRAADALQLAAALVASRERPPDLPFVTLDERLAEAATREGFPVAGLPSLS